MKTKTTLIGLLVVVFSLFGLGTWGLINHYETKLSKQEITYKNLLEAQRKEAEDRFIQRVQLAKETEDGYKNQIHELVSKVQSLDSLNSDLDRTIDGMRKSERDLRTRLNKLSSETEREYAIAATEAFREVSEALAEEQRAHQETSAEAERYWLGWKALDNAWDLPIEGKVKEDGQ